MNGKTFATTAVIVLTALGSSLAQVLHVSPNGAADGTGAPEKPLAFRAALERASADASVTGIVLAEGEYTGQFSLHAPKDADRAALPLLHIRAAGGQKVVIHHSVQITAAEPVTGMSGLYRSDRLPPSEPEMWERDTRVRYRVLSNKASVGAVPGSCFVDRDERALYFRTSDGRPPAEHKLFLAMSALNSYALLIYRPNVCVEGITFRDYVGRNVCTIGSFADRTTIRRCHFDNCTVGWSVFTNVKEAAMEDCDGVDVAQPVFSGGDHFTVRGCRFEKRRDAFLYELYPQNDCAYQVYSPGRGGTIIGNFAKGYYSGVWIKAGGGRYVIRHNTIVDAHYGIMWVTGNHDSDTSHNLIVNAAEFVAVRRFAPTFTMDSNLYWNPKQPSAFAERMKVVRGANRGRHDTLADPRFVDPANGDYRVLPDSPALLLKDGEGRPAGAFGAAPADAAAKAKPTLELAFTADTRGMGRTGEGMFDRDPWIGGGTTKLRDLAEESSLPRRLTAKPSATLRLLAFDAVGSITKLRIAIGDESAQETPYAPTQELKLPDQDGDYRVRVEVQNDRGISSDPAEAIIRLDRQPPRIVGAPTILANDHGVIVTFRTDEPCFAEARHEGGKTQTPALVKRDWNANDGGEYVETWNVARTEHALAILRPKVKTGQKVRLRIALKDEGGLEFQSKEFVATVRGKPRTLYVATTGEDDPGGGTKEKPLRTIQFAAERALPGDRIVLLPGVYTEPTFLAHGGVDEKSRVTIEAETAGTVTLDCAKRAKAVIHLESAPFVALRNLRILYFQRAGLYAYRSPNLTVEGCTFYNGPGWETGYHVFCFYSPRATVTRNLAVGAEYGFYFLESPRATVTRNTASQHMYAAAAYTFSAEGSVQMHNSFAFAGNDIYTLELRRPEELRTFRSDFNNLGTNVTDYNRAFEQGKPELWKQMKAEEFKTDYDPVRFLAGSKAIVGVDGSLTRYFTMKSWREFSGQDAHSIFADPQYVKPYPPIDSWDWRVGPDSPNMGAGENKSDLGAFENSSPTRLNASRVP